MYGVSRVGDPNSCGVSLAKTFLGLLRVELPIAARVHLSRPGRALFSSLVPPFYVAAVFRGFFGSLACGINPLCRFVVARLLKPVRLYGDAPLKSAFLISVD